jgi:hypothetical protein
VEFIAVDFIKVFVDILIREIATDEHAIQYAIWSGKFGQCTSSLSLSQIVQ